MPLSHQPERELLHTRRVTCRGYRRADGRWDIEGHMTDIKTYGFANEDRGEIAAGDPVHDMWLRLTLDDAFTIEVVEAVTDKAPFGVCGAITPAFQTLVGLTIGPGWTGEVKRRLGGVRGCTHLVELLGPMATTAFQTIHPIRMREAAARAARGEQAAPAERSRLIDTCHAFARDDEIVRRMLATHEAPPPGGDGRRQAD